MNKDKLFQSVSHISLMTTDACNLRCSYCFIECTPANNPKMRLETAQISARRLIQQSEYSRIFLHIYGGEPLTMEDAWLEEFVQYSRTLAREHGKEAIFPLSTSGTLPGSAAMAQPDGEQNALHRAGKPLGEWSYNDSLMASCGMSCSTGRSPFRRRNLFARRVINPTT